MATRLPNEPSTTELTLTSILYALSDETRLLIIDRLAETDEVACSYFDIHMHKSSLSHHFRVLRTSGVITTRKEGTALLNRLRKADIDSRFPGLLDAVIRSRAKVKKRDRAKQPA